MLPIVKETVDKVLTELKAINSKLDKLVELAGKDGNG